MHKLTRKNPQWVPPAPQMPCSKDRRFLLFPEIKSQLQASHSTQMMTLLQPICTEKAPSTQATFNAKAGTDPKVAQAHANPFSMTQKNSHPTVEQLKTHTNAKIVPVSKTATPRTLPQLIASTSFVTPSPLMLTVNSITGADPSTPSIKKARSNLQNPLTTSLEERQDDPHIDLSKTMTEQTANPSFQGSILSHLSPKRPVQEVSLSLVRDAPLEIALEVDACRPTVLARPRVVKLFVRGRRPIPRMRAGLACEEVAAASALEQPTVSSTLLLENRNSVISGLPIANFVAIGELPDASQSDVHNARPKAHIFEELKQKYIIGKTVSRNIYDSNGQVIITADQTITADNLDMAEKCGKLAELIVWMK